MNGTILGWLKVSPRPARSAGRRRKRRGVSLMEVLISIFVLSIGLMSVAALIPVGRFSIVETGKADRSAACGRAALREVKVRKMLQKKRPALDDASTIVPMQLPELTATSNNGKFDFGTPSSPVETGYEQVTRNSTYPTTFGSIVGGWQTGGDPIAEWSRGVSGGSALYRDFNYAKSGTFVVDVIPGTYRVTVLLGDTGTGSRVHDLMQVSLEGQITPDSPVTSNKDVQTCGPHEVTVNDGQLTVLVEDLGGSDVNMSIVGLEVERVGKVEASTSMIDPLSWARYPSGDVRDFPYCTYAKFPNCTFSTQDGRSLGMIVMPRITLRSAPYTDSYLTSKGIPLSMSESVANRIFTWQDDLVFDRPNDDDQRPTILDDSSGVRPNEGNYSWTAMVTPTPGYTDLWRVSIVVFYKRKLEATLNLADISTDNPKPSERVAVATFVGSGYGGGDVELAVPANPTNPADTAYVRGNINTTEAMSEYLDVKENDWIMLTNGERFHWYRVVSVASELTTSTTSGQPVRLVTLAGPDWKPDWCLNLDNLPNTNPKKMDDAQAVICDQVIGVYTQTVNLDSAPGW